MCNTSAVNNLWEVWYTSNQCLDIQLVGSNISRRSAVMHYNTINATNSRGRRKIPYGDNNQNRKFYPKLTEVY